MPRERIQIVGDWHGRDRHLFRLAQATGFQTVNKLLAHVAYEVSHAKTPDVFYRGLSAFYEQANRKRSRK